MAAGDTKADLDLIANFANEIDLGEIGLNESEINDILNIANGGGEDIPDIFEELSKLSKTVPEKGSAEYEANKARVKEGKAISDTPLCPVVAVEVAVAYGFGKVFILYVMTFCEVGDGACHFQYSVVGTCAQAACLHHGA